MRNIEILSTHPLVLKDSGDLYENIINKINLVINNFEPQKFSFNGGDGVKFNEKYRFIYETKKIVEIAKIREDLKLFCETKLISHFEKLNIICTGDKINIQENIKFALRIRIMKDIYDYSLPPHKDSADTIFSFILQLDFNNPGTSLYKKEKIVNLTKNEDIKVQQKELELIIKNEENNENLKIEWGQGQFGFMPCAWTENYCYKFSEGIKKLMYEKYSEITIKPKKNEIYAISNVNNGLLDSNILHKFNDNNYHDVRPVRIKERKLLIMDLIAKPTDLDILTLEGVNTNPNEFYILFKKESSRNLIEELVR
jgi:hypothetical protein